MNWVPVGKLSRTHGLKGEFKFHSLFNDQESLQSWSHLKLQGDQGIATELEFESLRGNPSSLIIKFKGIDSIDDAQALAGQNVFAPEDEFPELPEGEYYRFEIVGLDVYDEAGRGYGKVTEVIVTGSNDVYVVSDGKKEILLPMIDQVVKKINLAEQKLTFHIVEGLLENDEI